MRDERANARCSDCGVEAARNDMFGAEPDLLCETCADKVRQRTAPKATGRLVSTVVSGAAPVCVAILVISGALFMVSKGWVSRRTITEWPAFAQWFTTIDFVHNAPDWFTPITQPWRLLTSSFLHGGILHFLFNLYAMWFLGRVVELRWGSGVMAAMLVGGGMVSGAASWLYDGPGVGLSGVLFGLAGFLFALRSVDQFARAVMTPYLTRMLIAWLVIGIVLAETGAWAVGNWAHGGGVAFGLVAGFAWRLPQRWMWYASIAVLTAASAVAVMEMPPTWLGG